MADYAGDKTHEPTPRRRQQAREAGRVAHSRDLAWAVLLLGSLGLLVFAGGALVEFLANLLRAYLGGEAWRSWIHTGGRDARLATSQFNGLMPMLARLVLPVLAGALALAVTASLLQTGFLVRTARLAPDFSRVNPLAGLRRVFSGASLVQLAFGVFKVGVVAAVGLAGLWSRREELAALAGLDVPRLAVQVWDVCFWTCLEMGGALLALAAVDYLYQRGQLERELKMTPQEVREEQRELNGDPQIAARRRDLRRPSPGKARG